MPEYDHVINVKCGGDTHRLGARKRPLEDHLLDDVGKYVVEMLDHDPEMIAGFTAFGAKPPFCHRLAKPMEKAINAYHATPKWWWVEWDTSIGSNRLDINMMSAKDVKEELANVERSEDDRISPLRDRLDELMAQLENVEGNWYLEEEIRKLEDRIENEEQVYWDWSDALEYAEKTEEEAMLSARAADYAYKQLVMGNIMNAWTFAQRAAEHSRRGDNHEHWDRFVRALSELNELAK
jgi:hypothetical protein